MSFPQPMRLRALALAMTVLLAWSASSAGASDDVAARRLVQAVVSDAVRVYGGQTLAPDEKTTKLAQLIDRYGDLSIYSADALGRHWTRASSTERSDFGKLLGRYLLGCWASALNDVPLTLHVDVTTTETLPNGRILIHSLAVVPNDTLAIDWTITPASDGHLIVADVVVDGISVFQTMNGDFQSILRANGGRLAALSEALEKKIATLGEAR